MYLFQKDASFCLCFCFVHTILDSSVLQNFKIFTHLLPNFSYKDPRFNIFGTFLTLSLKLMQWYVTSVSRGSLYEKFCNKCVKILKFWRTLKSYAQNKNRAKKMRLLGMDTCPSLNDIMEIRCNKCTRRSRGTIFKPVELHALCIISIYIGSTHAI